MEGYNKLLVNAKTFRVGKFVKTGKILLDLIIPGDSTVLDFGCGPEGTISKMNRSIEFFDIDSTNKIANYNCMADVSKVYDFLVSHHVVEHMNRDEMIEFYRWASKHCKYLVLGQPNGENIWVPFYIDVTHTRPYYAFPTARLLEQLGFTVEKVYYCNVEPGIRRKLFDVLFQVNPYQEFVIVAKSNINKTA